MKFTASQVSAFRLKRHRLTNEDRRNLVSVCRDVCGVQAQLMSAAEVAIWTRNHGISREDVEDALYKSRKLVRTSLMRQTLHIIPSSEFSLYVSALRRSRREALLRYMSRFGVQEGELDKLNHSLLRLLEDGPKPRTELTARLLSKAGKGLKRYMKVAWDIQLFRGALVEGLICFGPNRDNQSTFVRVADWITVRRTISEDKAKEMLLRNYLAAYGPATPQDFSKWSGIQMKEIGGIGHILKEDLTEVTVEDERKWLLSEDLEELSRSRLKKPVLRLLPSFDPFLLGHAERKHLIDIRRYKHVYRNQGWIAPVILFDGRVVGVWSVNAQQSRTSIEVKQFERFTRSMTSELEKEAAELARFMGKTLRMRFTHS